MHQSPDDVFAAHFWSWPDPALKRDAQGRVLFVNAAFLQLFGGRVEDWRGQSVGGWHAPQPGPAPARFEIRTPATPTLSEQVYDWVELAGPDGSAFALARNVTVFAGQAVPPNTPASHPDPAAGSAVRLPVDAAPAFDDRAVSALPDMPVPPAAVPHETPAAPVAAAEEAPQAPDVALDVPQIDVPVLDVPQIEVPDIDMPGLSDAPRAEVEVEADVDIEPAPTPAPAARIELPPVDAAPATQPVAASEEPDRAYERRALPIESGDSVLGSNWRDAVIAKAVGAVAEAPADAQESAAEAAPAATAPGTSSEPGAPIRILLAEDNAINALLTRTLLEAEGHTVETVEDGVLAVEAMKTSSFDMIFMDMRMPNMDGLEATRKIRALPNLHSDLPIVALTANAFDDDRNACFDSGMNDFMTKPVSAEELSEMVERWTGKSAEAPAIAV